jgi:hypothetical protein
MSPQLLLPALKKQFWFRRHLNRIFTESLRSAGHDSGQLCSYAAMSSQSLTLTPTAEHSILNVNADQLSGAIYLPLVHRASKTPVVFVNTHIACNFAATILPPAVSPHAC